LVQVDYFDETKKNCKHLIRLLSQFQKLVHISQQLSNIYVSVLILFLLLVNQKLKKKSEFKLYVKMHCIIVSKENRDTITRPIMLISNYDYLLMWILIHIFIKDSLQISFLLLLSFYIRKNKIKQCAIIFIQLFMHFLIFLFQSSPFLSVNKPFVLYLSIFIALLINQ